MRRLAWLCILPVLAVALAGCFGNGFHRVGTPLTSEQMPPGLWRSLGGNGCTWWRFDANGAVVGASTHSTGPQFMQVAPDDSLTAIRNCVPFTQQPGPFTHPVVQPGQPFGDGDFLTTYELKPGRYHASFTAGTSCTWSVMSGFHGAPTSGTNPDVVRSGSSTSGSAFAMITDADFGFSSQGCGQWVWVSPPDTKPSPVPSSTDQGFDACAAPSTTTAATWWKSSPYTSMGIYLGGANRGCAQPNLTSSWITTVTSQGWKLLPLWVGPQAPCTTLGNATKLSSNPTVANAEGQAEANAAANAAAALGFGLFAPVYYDMEAYPRGGACSTAIQNFTNGWIAGLNQRGYLAGMYTSLCSGVQDQAAGIATGFAPLNSIWIAAWNNTPNIFGFTAPCALSDSLWFNHQRVHQFKGSNSETWGGVTINIDTNAVDGAVAAAP